MLSECIDAIENAQKRMAMDQAEIDHLRIETREILQRDWRGVVNVEAILGPIKK
jgi:predicted aminopeptidase